MERANAVAQPWTTFHGALEVLEQSLADYFRDLDDRDRADGYRHLALLLQSALQWYLLGNDPDSPRFCQLNDTPEIADNLFAAVRPEGRYRISASVASLFDFNISLHEGGNFRGKPRVWGDLGRRELQVGPDGRFELILSATPEPGNWLALPPEARMVQVREYFADLDHDAPGSFLIERLDAPSVPPPRPSLSDIEAGLREAVAWVEDYVRFHHYVFHERRVLPRNGVEPPGRQPAGNRHIHYAFGSFALRADEALILTLDPSAARLWSVQWMTLPFYANPDIWNRLTSVTSTDAHLDGDGNARLVFSAHDPGVRNWLDIGGYDKGIFVVRWLWSDPPKQPLAEVVPKADLYKRLPANTPMLDESARAMQIARRRAHYARRRR